MKRVLCLLIIFLLFTSKSMAETYEAKYCPVAERNETGTSVSKIVSSLAGSNFLFSKTAEIALQNIINKTLNTRANVEIYPFSAVSFLQGKFKKMYISAKEINVDGVYLSSFDAETVCDYNHLWVKNNKLLFKENFVMEFSGKITNNNLAKTIKSPEYINLLQSAKISAWGQDIFIVNYATPRIKNNKLYIEINISSPVLWGTKAKTYLMSADLSVKEGKIIYSNIEIENMALLSNIQPLLSLINYVNPFNFAIKLSDNSFGYTFIKSVIIKNNEVKINGVLYIPKND